MKLAGLVWLLAGSAELLAQPPLLPSFELASVKLMKAAPGSPFPRESITTSPGTLTMRSVTLKACIAWAYQVQDFQISGARELDSDRFEIVAKAASAAAEAELRLMLRALLAERMKLALHRESKTMQVFALLPGKNGPKLPPPETDGDYSVQVQRTSLTAQKASMAQLAEILTAGLHSPVIDMSGIPGRFTIKLDVARCLGVDLPKEDGLTGEGLVFFAAVQDQLGLRLERRKAAVDIWVVDHAEKPTETSSSILISRRRS